MVSELRNERELRTLLEEKVRSFSVMDSDSELDFTCESLDSTGYDVTSNYNQIQHELEVTRNQLSHQIAMAEQVQLVLRERITELEQQVEREKHHRIN